jgi:BASS family bile acid:Na+ symporter
MDLSRLTAPIIITGILCGLFFPIFKIFSPIITVLLGIVIFSVCLNISVDSIAESLKKPKQHGIMLLVLFVLQPLATWLIARQFVQNPLILAGIVLVSAGPTPTGLGFWIHSIKGNVSLSLTFTAISHLLTPLIIPAIAYLLLGSYVTVPVLGMARTLALTILIPMVLALFLQRFHDIKKYTSIIALPAYFLLIATMISLNAETLFAGTDLLIITIFIIFQSIFSFGSAYLLSPGWPKRDREVLLIGAFTRNNAIIMAVAIAGFGALAALPGVVAIIIQLMLVAIYLHFKKPE